MAALEDASITVRIFWISLLSFKIVKLFEGVIRLLSVLHHKRN